MSNSAVPLPSTAEDAWAEVCAGSQLIRYRWRGAGRPVLMLTPADGPLAPWPELLDALCAEFRMILPEPLGNAIAEDWLGVLLDGLGLQQVSTVVAGELCMAALERALMEPEQLARIVFIGEGRGRTEALDGGFETDRGLARVPMLIARRDRSAGEVVPVIMRFLRGAIDRSAP